MKKNFNRNPEGHNQWILRSNEEIQKIIDKHPTWTKKDFRGEGKLNPNKKNALLTRKETDVLQRAYSSYLVGLEHSDPEASNGRQPLSPIHPQ